MFIPCSSVLICSTVVAALVSKLSDFVLLLLSEEEEDRKLRELIAKKDNKAFMDTLTRGNRRKPARNTSILTSYDRHGRLVKPEDAEAGRLMHHENAEKENVTVRKQGTYRKYI